MDASLFSNHIKLAGITLTDSFWLKKLELMRNEVIPYQYDALHDRIDDADKSYSIENFIKAAKVIKMRDNGELPPLYPVDKWFYNENNSCDEAFHGWVFQDSDVYKWIEAVAFSLLNFPDSKLEQKADEIIELILSAQMSDGYIDTLFIINDISKRFSNLKDWHELYCFGHLLEAAVAYLRATGKEKLFNAACRFADLICDTFGEDKLRGYPGHEIAEMALVKLYDITSEEKYLETARFFISERGKKPYYYDVVEGKATVYDNYHYNQAHTQPVMQEEAVGHAVRGVYLYSGMADVAKRCKDEALYKACRKIADNIINRKMFITGGIGSTADGEAFSFDYDLPNDLCYNETCASVGLIFFLRRMLEIAPDAVFGDTIERALYNTVLAGVALDGKSFFYVNPLEVLPQASEEDSRKRHIRPVRQKWFGCACCPPNLARMISSVCEYALTENENTLFIHQYFGLKASAANAEIEIQSSYIEDGKVKLMIKPKKEFTLAVRIPLWCEEYSFTYAHFVKNGYAYFRIDKECVIDVCFELKAKLMKCSNKVRANMGKAAVIRGPFVYCMEEIDNGKNLHLISLGVDSDFMLRDDELLVSAFREKESESLYSEWSREETERVTVKLIPYYRWANRGENEMIVYIRLQQ